MSSLCWPFRRARLITDWDPCLTWITSVHEQNIIICNVHCLHTCALNHILCSHSDKKHVTHLSFPWTLDTDEQMVFDGLCLLPSKIWAVSDLEPHLRAREGHLRPKGTAWGWKSIITHALCNDRYGRYRLRRFQDHGQQTTRAPAHCHPHWYLAEIWKGNRKFFEAKKYRQNYITIQQCPAELRMFWWERHRLLPHCHSAASRCLAMLVLLHTHTHKHTVPT